MTITEEIESGEHMLRKSQGLELCLAHVRCCSRGGLAPSGYTALSVDDRFKVNTSNVNAPLVQVVGASRAAADASNLSPAVDGPMKPAEESDSSDSAEEDSDEGLPGLAASSKRKARRRLMPCLAQCL